MSAGQQELFDSEVIDSARCTCHLARDGNLPGVVTKKALPSVRFTVTFCFSVFALILAFQSCVERVQKEVDHGN